MEYLIPIYLAISDSFKVGGIVVPTVMSNYSSYKCLQFSETGRCLLGSSCPKLHVSTPRQVSAHTKCGDCIILSAPLNNCRDNAFNLLILAHASTVPAAKKDIIGFVLQKQTIFSARGLFNFGQGQDLLTMVRIWDLHLWKILPSGRLTCLSYT